MNGKQVAGNLWNCIWCLVFLFGLQVRCIFLSCSLLLNQTLKFHFPRTTIISLISSLSNGWKVQNERKYQRRIEKLRGNILLSDSSFNIIGISISYKCPLCSLRVLKLEFVFSPWLLVAQTGSVQTAQTYNDFRGRVLRKNTPFNNVLNFCNFFAPSTDSSLRETLTSIEQRGKTNLK